MSSLLHLLVSLLPRARVAGSVSLCARVRVVIRNDACLAHVVQLLPDCGIQVAKRLPFGNGGDPLAVATFQGESHGTTNCRPFL